jgi:hypothetical protein
MVLPLVLPELKRGEERSATVLAVTAPARETPSAAAHATMRHHGAVALQLLGTLSATSGAVAGLGRRLL